GIKSVDDYRQTAGTTSVLSVFDIASRTLVVDGGVLTGGGTIIGDVANNAGIVAPGNSPGTLTIDGDYAQGAAATLLIEIAGFADFDVLAVSGSAQLGGELAVSLAAGYLPGVGASFDILLANDINGVFANGQFVDAGRAVFEILYLDGLDGDIVRLTTVSAVPLPAGVWLLLGALGTLFARARRRAC
ncbi:MAG: VPLPA-CTERM sorting domain-containing protein, partial [Gammaproteobacteria bacterium]